MDEQDLSRFIARNRIKAEIIRLDVETPTVEAAAAALGVKTEQIGKSILFVVKDDPVLVIANGLARVDYRRLSDFLQTSRKKIKLANAKQVLQFTGYPVGTVPPFGHKKPLKTIIDTCVIEQEEIYAGGGNIQVLLRIATDELQRVVAAPPAALTEV